MGLTEADEAALREFYAAQQPRLVGVVSLLTGSRTEAEDIVQEAFVRLVPRWGKVSRYESPEGWLRLVAVRLAGNRHRNATRFASLLRRLPAHGVPDPADGQEIDLERALAQLPMPSRQAAVLYYVCDLAVPEIATTLGIAEGTVKSRLSRARAALSQTMTPRGADHE
jgi:RNA polymerase sigma-70 factor (ECF subfamily)